MVMDDISLDLVQLFEKKYQSRFLFNEFLNEVSSAAELARETSIVQERVRSDIYGIFEKDLETGNLSGEGNELLSGCRVSQVTKTQTTNAYCVEVCIDLALPAKSSAKDKDIKKRKRELKTKTDGEKIQLWYKFEELSCRLKTRNDTANEMKCPCKTVSMSVWTSHGAGFDKRLIFDFNLLTSGVSPSESRREYNYCDKGTCDDLATAYDAWRRTADISDAEDADDITHNKSDYFSVYVDTAALIDLGGAISNSLCGAAEEQSVLSERGGENCLLFLLAMPYVDEAWGIHDAVLDNAYPQDSDGSDDEGDEDCSADEDEEVENAD